MPARHRISMELRHVAVNRDPFGRVARTGSSSRVGTAYTARPTWLTSSPGRLLFRGPPGSGLVGSELVRVWLATGKVRRAFSRCVDNRRCLIGFDDGVCRTAIGGHGFAVKRPKR